jgi:hypothetical protein
MIGTAELGRRGGGAHQLRQITRRSGPTECPQGRMQAREVPLQERELPPTHPNRLDQPLAHPRHCVQYYI